MHRRGLVKIGAVSALPGGWLAALHGAAFAANPRRVAWVSIDSPNPSNQSLRVWREGMRELGWIEGQNLVVDLWWAEGSNDKLKAMVPQILARNPEVIVATTGPAIRPFVDAQVAVPVVFAFSADPVQAKVVQSWARPGVNRTGVSYFSLELVPKRIQLIKEMLPRAQRLAVVGWPPHGGELLELDAARSVAQGQGLALEYWGTAAPRSTRRWLRSTPGSRTRCWSSPAWWPPAMPTALPPGRCGGGCLRSLPGPRSPRPAT
jgi:putative tryptophan/tyrosine transport system substrate-binding protein